MNKFKINKNKRAFTLAEVLITLGIIGIVAALTMPSLIQNRTNHETEVKLKKFYSIMSQAISRSTLDNGTIDCWNLTDDWGNTYLVPYLKVVSTQKIKHNTYGDKNLYVLADGSAFSTFYAYIDFFPKNAQNCKAFTDYYQIGSCNFRFEIFPEYNALAYPKYKENITDISSLYFGSLGCGQQGDYCTTAIIINGWKIPSNYPLKIKY